MPIETCKCTNTEYKNFNKSKSKMAGVESSLNALPWRMTSAEVHVRVSVNICGGLSRFHISYLYTMNK